jgi:hypothetical protein
MPDPVSWKVMEPGWRVLDAGGHVVGKVVEIEGDPEADIFDGLRVRRHLLGRTEYVAADDVAEIRQGEVLLAR